MGVLAKVVFFQGIHVGYSRSYVALEDEYVALPLEMWVGAEVCGVDMISFFFGDVYRGAIGVCTYDVFLEWVVGCEFLGYRPVLEGSEHLEDAFDMVVSPFAWHAGFGKTFVYFFVFADGFLDAFFVFFEICVFFS